MRGTELLETLVGGAVLAAGLIALALFYGANTASTTAGYPIRAEFGHVGGLSIGADVRLGGIKVGTVSAMDLDPKTYRAMVAMSVREGIALPTDTVAKIVTYGLMGDPLISLELGGEEKIVEPNGALLYAQDAVNVVDLVTRLVESGIEAEMEKQQP